MKTPKPKQAFVGLGLYMVSLLLLLISAFIHSPPVLVFSLSYQPLNITTTATIDEENFLVLSELNQEIGLPMFPQGQYRLEVVTSGGMVVESLADSGVSVLTLVVDEKTMAMNVDTLIGEHQLTWWQASSSSLTITMTNFVNINGSLRYGIYIQDIRLYKI
jgi:hypothetical protein